MSVKKRVQELNTRLAEKLTNKGVHADGSETTTSLINKVDDIVNKIPNGYIKPEGSMDINENGTFDVTEKAEVNVQVVAKPAKPYIDSSKLKNGDYMFAKSNTTINLNADISPLKELIENLDSSEMVTAKYMFSERRDMEEPANHLNFENCLLMEGLYNNCRTMKGTIKINAPKNTVYTSAFSYTQQITEIDLGDTSKVTLFNGAFSGSSVETISELDCSSVTQSRNLMNIFNQATKLKNVTFTNIPITDNSFSVQYSTQLTIESLLNILNALSDNTGLSTTYIVHLGSANLAKLTQEQKEIAYNKNIDLD